MWPQNQIARVQFYINHHQFNTAESAVRQWDTNNVIHSINQSAWTCYSAPHPELWGARNTTQIQEYHSVTVKYTLSYRDESYVCLEKECMWVRCEYVEGGGSKRMVQQGKKNCLRVGLAVRSWYNKVTARCRPESSVRHSWHSWHSSS